MNKIKPELQGILRVAYVMNYGCLFFLFGPLLILKLYIAFSGDYSVRWMVITFLPFLLIGGIAWAFAFVVSLASWIKKGNERTVLSERWAALLLPICVAIISVT